MAGVACNSDTHLARGYTIQHGKKFFKQLAGFRWFPLVSLAETARMSTVHIQFL